jgi:hypothetical protein
MNRRGWLYALPVLIFVGIAAGFYYGLTQADLDRTILPLVAGLEK